MFSRHSDFAMGRTIGRPSFDFRLGQEFYLFSTTSRPSLVPDLFLNGYHRRLPGGGGADRLDHKAGHSPHGDPKSRIRGALPPLFYIPSLRGHEQIHILPIDRSAMILEP
jgi:hypothetical protein